MTKKAFPLLCFTAIFSFSGIVSAQNQTSTLSPVERNTKLPYVISLSQYDMGKAKVPTLQSFALGVYQGEWVLVAGRTNGLHNFTNSGLKNFPPRYQNSDIWVINPVTQKVWHRSIKSNSAGLTVSEQDSLSATNTESLQIGETLYFAGGYVYDRTADNFTTYDTLSALDLEGTVDWVKNGTGTLKEHLRQTTSPFVKVAGGEMRLGDNGRALLVFGQDFEGPYDPTANGVYTRQVRSFKIQDDGATLSIQDPKANDPKEYYRRRDLNVVPTRFKDGASYIDGFVALAGVFLPGATGGAWTVPVEITGEGKPSMLDPSSPKAFKQGMNTYRSATISLFSDRDNQTHTVALGGISLEYYNASTNSIAYDATVPFVNAISAIVTNANGKYRQSYLGDYPQIFNPANKDLPFLFGAEADFIPLGGIKQVGKGMLDLDDIKVPTVIGYIYGGIVADEPNFGTTAASNLIFSVKLTPVLSFSLDSDRQVKTSASSLTFTGGSTAPAQSIEWKVGRGKFQSKTVEEDGSWKVTISNLGIGNNEVRFRIAGQGNTSMSKLVRIKRVER